MTKTQRTGAWHGVLAICIAAGFAAVVAPGMRAQAAASTEKPATAEALFVSDIHFEPFWDPGKAAKLMAAPVSEWNAILAEPVSADQAAKFAELQTACKARGVDTSYALYKSSLMAIKRDAAGAKFVVLSGDLIAHDFSCKFDATFPNAKPGEYRAFVEKTIEYVMRELRGALPGVPVYAALGNNDSDCGDYELDQNGAFLAETGRILTADFPADERANALQDFCRGRVLQRAAASAAGAHADAGAGRFIYVAAVCDVWRKGESRAGGGADCVAGTAIECRAAKPREGVGDVAHSAGRGSLLDGDEGAGPVQRGQAEDVFEVGGAAGCDGTLRRRDHAGDFCAHAYG